MKFRKILLTLALCAMCVGQASALEYTYDAPEDYLFGRPTSQDAPYTQEDPNVDRSKNVALIPPGFGSPTSYLPGSGEALTPNLVPSVLNGGLVNQVGSVNYPAIDNGAQAPSVDSNFSYTTQPNQTQTVGFTDVTDNLYYSGGHLGTLKIPAIGLSVKVYQGTDSKTLAKGAGHFTDTSIWDGNVCVAGHNRGVNAHFDKIHTLEPGDTITLTTQLGTRSYAAPAWRRSPRRTPAAPPPPAITGSRCIHASGMNGTFAGRSQRWRAPTATQRSGCCWKRRSKVAKRSFRRRRKRSGADFATTRLFGDSIRLRPPSVV